MHKSIKHTVLWTLKSDRDAISLSNSNVADVAEGFAELETEKQKRKEKKNTITVQQS